MFNISTPKNKILVIGPSWIGDMVMAQSLFKQLKYKNPSVQIDVISPTYMLPLLERMPEIHMVHASPFQHGEFGLWKRYKFGKKLREQGYQQAIVLQNSWKSALIPFFAKIPIRTGWIGEFRYGLLNDLRILNKEHYPLMVERFIALGLNKDENKLDLKRTKYLLPELSPIEQDIKSTLQKHNLNKPDVQLLALCPGAAFGPSKCWPAEYFAQIATVYLERNWQVWLFGSKKDEIHSQLIQAQTQNKCINLTGKTTLIEAIDLLSLANIVIANDSGLMHIAAALDKPVVAIYGSTTSKFAPPLSERARTVSIDLKCRPCFKRKCPLKHHRCMTDLKPILVLETLQELI